jgi:hypothetical protein
MNVLKHHGILAGQMGRKAKDVGVFIGNNALPILATQGGLVEHLDKLNDKGEAGQKVAIHRNSFGEVVAEYASSVAGEVTGRRSDAMCEPGNPLALILFHSRRRMAVRPIPSNSMSGRHPAIVLTACSSGRRRSRSVARPSCAGRTGSQSSMPSTAMAPSARRCCTRSISWSSTEEDLRALPLGDRKKRLARLLGKRRIGIVISEHTDEDGALIFRRACKLGLEGIMSKRLNAPYRSAIKNPDSPAMVRSRLCPAGRSRAAEASGGINMRLRIKAGRMSSFSKDSAEMNLQADLFPNVQSFFDSDLGFDHRGTSANGDICPSPSDGR